MLTHITLTEEVLDQLYPEKMKIPFFEALLSNVTLLYFARTNSVLVIPSGGLTLTSGQPPTQPLAHSSPSVSRGQGEKIGRTRVNPNGCKSKTQPIQAAMRKIHSIAARSSRVQLKKHLIQWLSHSPMWKMYFLTLSCWNWSYIAHFSDECSKCWTAWFELLCLQRPHWVCNITLKLSLLKP